MKHSAIGIHEDLITDKRMSSGAVRLASIIAAEAYEETGDESYTVATNADLAKKMGSSVSSIWRYMKQALAAGHVRREFVKTDKGNVRRLYVDTGSFCPEWEFEE